MKGYHDILSVLYLTYIPLRPSQPPRSRTTSIRDASRSSTPRPGKGFTPIPTSPSSKTAMNVKTEINNHESLPMYEHTMRDSPEWEILRQCAEAVSIYRVRDAMGKGMEPMMGLLKYVLPKFSR